MRTLHLTTPADIEVVVPLTLIRRLPRRVALFTTAQLLHLYEDLSEQLVKEGKDVVRIRTSHTRKEGQLLGCNVQPLNQYTDKEFDATLFVGDGLFHPQALFWKNDAPSFLYDPFTQQEHEVSAPDVRRMRARYEGALSAFHMARVVGVLIPVKPGGQTYLAWALELKELYPDKTFVMLVDYNVDKEGLENFPFCEVYVNTACPRIAYEDAARMPRPVVNLEDVSESFLAKQLSAR